MAGSHELDAHEVDGGARRFVIDRLHAFPGQRASILDLAVSRCLEDSSRTKLLPKFRIAHRCAIRDLPRR